MTYTGMPKQISKYFGIPTLPFADEQKTAKCSEKLNSFEIN
jgi:hypothetical protein